MATKIRRSFTDEFKQEAVSLLASSGRPLTQVARELGIQPSMLRHWRDDRQAKGAVTRPAGSSPSGGTSAEHAEIHARVATVPDMTIAELRDWLRTAHGISVSHAVMWETLGRLGLSLKKRPSTPPNRNAPMSRLRARNGVSCSPC